MQTVSLCALTIDPLGVIRIPILDQASGLGSVSRRVSRTRTLDGGYALHDGGYAASDRDIRLEWLTNSDIDDAVERLVRLYGRATLSQRDGCYLVALSSFRRGTPRSAINILVLERLSE
jgi:hypothetical protein